MSKGSVTYIGKLRSNFLGTKFMIYDSQPPRAGAMVSKCRSTRVVGSKQVSLRVPAATGRVTTNTRHGACSPCVIISRRALEPFKHRRRRHIRHRIWQAFDGDTSMDRDNSSFLG
ncbi:hypothetical protein ACHQM5_013489 [Ranunculus cassubicifolius]